MFRCVISAIWMAATWMAVAGGAESTKVLVKSSMDGAEQPIYVVLPEGFNRDKGPVPLLVSLHSWSYDVEQRNLEREAAAERRGWICVCPNFRGRNDRPEALGSRLAQQDILDAVKWVQEHYPIDRRRIYITGTSGGGHMTMLMAARHPEVWAAASAWAGISDLKAWHDVHVADDYGQMMRQACGGAPGTSAEVDRQYHERSPKSHLQGAVGVPLEIAHGVHDGHQGSVPVRQALEAFNVIAIASGVQPITEEEIKQLSRQNGRLEKPRPGDEVQDQVFGRQIYLRRMAGPARISIFDGGHEGITDAALDWLARHQKPK
jgi:dienelactone hydrolase